METMASVVISRSAADVLAFVTSPASRECWPGALPPREDGDALRFEVDLQLPGVPAATLAVREHLRAVERLIRLESDARWTWPTGENVASLSRHELLEFPDQGVTRLGFTLSYASPPALGPLITPLVDRVVRAYLDEVRRRLEGDT